MDLIICGAGAVGLAIAWRASQEGLSVLVLDQREIGRGASWAGAGILPPGASRQRAFQVLDPIEQLRSASHAMFPDWCQQLYQQTEIDVGFRQCGGWYLACSPGELATLAASEMWWDDHGIRYERWGKSFGSPPVDVLESATRSKRLLGAWFLPDEWQVRNPRYLQALQQACLRSGVTIRDHEAVVKVAPESSGGVVRLKTSKQEYQSKQVCFTTGAWTPLVTRDLVPNETGIVPIRGQMILIKLPRQTFQSIINEGHRYVVPRDDGHVLVGSCEEEAGYDEQPTDSMQRELLDWAFDLVPSLRDGTIVKQWAGLRPGSIDGLPYLGSIPGKQGMFVAAGHYRHGLHWSPITASLMVDLICGRKPALEMSPFSLTRGSTYTKSS